MNIHTAAQYNMAGLCSFIGLVAALSFILVRAEATTDQQIQELSNLVQQMKNQYDTQIAALTENIVKQDEKILRQEEKIVKQDVLIHRLFHIVNAVPNVVEGEQLLNTTIEERVALLEIEVDEIQDEVSDLETNMDFLFGEQIIQDERLLNLEIETEGVEEEVEVLQDTTLALDFRVTILEENGGGDGNSSVAELEVRVETLEGTADDHEARISVAETDIEDLETASADHEMRLTTAEENIQGLQATDVSLDARVTALEESGGGSSENETVAFQAYTLTTPSIPVGETVEFETVLFNQGSGYDESTGVFTVPAGGDGFYFFSTYLLAPSTERSVFDITLNGEIVCSAYADDDITNVFPQGTCTSVIQVTEGDEVEVVVQQGDGTPISGNSLYRWNGFNGFKI